MATTPVSLPGEPHGQRSLVGYGPWGRKESDMIETTEHADGEGVMGGSPCSLADLGVGRALCANLHIMLQMG